MAHSRDTAPQRLHLLLVDDRRDVLLASGRLLEIAGFEVAVAPNGAAALVRARELRPQVIVTDLVMPEVAGEEFCRRLRARESTRDIPVLVYTAVTDVSALATMFRLGVRVFAIKPCLPGVVGEQARALVEHPPPTSSVRIVTGFGEPLDDLARDVLGAARSGAPS
jgi:PleD family two-component response regulator